MLELAVFLEEDQLTCDTCWQSACDNTLAKCTYLSHTLRYCCLRLKKLLSVKNGACIFKFYYIPLIAMHLVENVFQKSENTLSACQNPFLYHPCHLISLV